MKILFDHCTPRPLRRYLPDHEVKTTYTMGWAEVTNGALLTLAEQEFDVFLTTDRNILDQQNMQGRQIVVIVLVGVNNKPVTLAPLMPQVNALLPTVEAGNIYTVQPEPATGQR